MNKLLSYLDFSQEGDIARAYRERTGRVLYLDIARGMAAILVVLIHSALGPSIFLKRFVNPTFYLLSGIFFTPEVEASRFAKRKFYGLVIPLIAFIIIGIIANYIFYDFSNFRNPEFRYRWPLAALGNTPLWFVVSLIYILAIAFCTEHWVKKPWAKMLIYSTFIILGWRLSADRIFTPLYFTQSLLGLPFFLIGYYMSEHLKNGRALSWWLLAACAVPIAWGVHINLLTNYHQLLHHGWYWPAFLAAIAMVYVLLCTARLLSRLSAWGWLCWIGTMSLYVMGLHDLIQSPLVDWARFNGYLKLHNPPIFYCIVGPTSACFFALVSAWLGKHLRRALNRLIPN